MENSGENTLTFAGEKSLSSSGSKDENNSWTSVSENGLSATALEEISADFQNKEYNLKRISNSDDEDALTDVCKLFCEKSFQSYDQYENNQGEVLDLNIDSMAIQDNCDDKIISGKMGIVDKFLVKKVALNFNSDDFLLETTNEIDNGNNSVNEGDLIDLTENNNEKCEETTEKIEKIENKMISSNTKIDDLLFAMFDDSTSVLTPANTVKEFEVNTLDSQFTHLNFQNDKSVYHHECTLPSVTDKNVCGIIFESYVPKKDHIAHHSDSEEYLENTFFVILSEQIADKHEAILDIDNMKCEHSELSQKIVHSVEKIAAEEKSHDDATGNASKMYEELEVTDFNTMERNEICQNNILGDINNETKFATDPKTKGDNSCESHDSPLKSPVRNHLFLPEKTEIEVHLEKAGFDETNTIYSEGSKCEIPSTGKIEKELKNEEKDTEISVTPHAQVKLPSNAKYFSVKKWKNLVESAFRRNRFKSHREGSPSIKEIKQNVSSQIISTNLKEKDEYTSKHLSDGSDSISKKAKPLKGILKKHLIETSREISQHTSPEKPSKQKNITFMRFFKRKVKKVPSPAGLGNENKLCVNADLPVDDFDIKNDPELPKKTQKNGDNKGSDTIKFVQFSLEANLLIYCQNQKPTDPMEILKVHIKDLKTSSDDSLGKVVSSENVESKENNLSPKVKVITPCKIKKFFTQTLRKPFKNRSPKKKEGKNGKESNLRPATENDSFDTSLDTFKAGTISDNIVVNMVSSSESSDMQEDSEEFVSKFTLLEECSSASEFSNQPSNSEEIHCKKDSKIMNRKFAIKSIFNSVVKKSSKK